MATVSSAAVFNQWSPESGSPNHPCPHCGAADVLKPSLKRRKRAGTEQSLSKPQLLMLLAAAKANRQRDWLMILVCFWHGLRASELVSFQTDAIQDGFLSIQRLNGSDPTTHALIEHPEPLLNEKNALIELAQQTDFGVPVFHVTRRRVDQLIKQYAAEAGIPLYLAHAHALRHTLARLSVESAGIEPVRRWLGHKKVGSLGRYLKGVEYGADRESRAPAERREPHEPPYPQERVLNGSI